MPRRPKVVVLDTGIGSHSWLTPELGCVKDGFALQVPVTNPELTGVTVDPYEGYLDSDAGHGTFIAGIIRQGAPDADVEMIAVMGGDGFVPESDLLDAVLMLALRQQNATQQRDAASFIDVLVLALGYYNENAHDLTYSSELGGAIRTLGMNGTAVVVAAGNDATDRPNYPAAFGPWQGITNPTADCVPVVSVGALNPTGQTIALFSNAGAWVTSHDVGVAVVSTFPDTFDGSIQPEVAVYVPGDGLRTTLDIDDLRGGFGTWSGTSFSAPLVAAKIAARLCGAQDLAAVDQATAVQRTWAAVTAQVPKLHP